MQAMYNCEFKALRSLRCNWNKIMLSRDLLLILFSLLIHPSIEQNPTQCSIRNRKVLGNHILNQYYNDRPRLSCAKVADSFQLYFKTLI